jgi:monoamine oxidase
MARTSLTQRLQELVATIATERGDAPARADAGTAISRRDALRLGGAFGIAAASGALASPAAARTSDSSPATVAIVGAGLAGLSCAYDLKRAGLQATVYEASSRVGGRSWTLRGAFADGQFVERGGQFIDQGHTEIRQLASGLGLTLDAVASGEPNGSEPFFWFDGAPYTYDQATDDLNGIYQKLHMDVSAASYPTLYNLSTARGRQLDQMSIIDWINESVPGGIGSKLGQLLDVAYTIEYGADSSQQSSLNLLYLLGFSGQGQLRLFGPSNEKYVVRGGCDQIPARLAAALAGQVRTGWQLTRVAQTAGAVTLTFKVLGKVKTVTADRVVLALPFSILRSVDLAGAGFKALKRTAINELGMGTNSKLHVQFTSRHWHTLGCNGDTFSDRGYQNTWDESRTQAGAAGILDNYTGGTVGAGYGTGTPTGKAQQFLAQLEPVLPGITARWNGRATIDYWTNYEWTKGSYSYWKVGQYARFAGVERELEGRCHFAGEHTSIDFQGFLNGAVETGQRAAAEVLDLVV